MYVFSYFRRGERNRVGEELTGELSELSESSESETEESYKIGKEGS